MILFAFFLGLTPGAFFGNGNGLGVFPAIPAQVLFESLQAWINLPQGGNISIVPDSVEEVEHRLLFFARHCAV